MNSEPKIIVNMLALLDRFGVDSVKPLMLAAMHDVLQAEVDGLMKQVRQQQENAIFYPEGVDE